MEEEADGEGGGGTWPQPGLGLMESLSFRTCSSAPSSPRSVRSLSFDLGDFPPMSEYEEIPSRRWLSALESLDSGDPHPPVTHPQPNEEKRTPRNWFLPLPLFLLPRSASSLLSPAPGGAWRKDKDPLLWFWDLGRHAFGDFSMAVLQANNRLEDQCQLESGSFGTFVGVYDGHGGPQAARYVKDHLFRNFRELSSGPLGVTSEAMERAFMETDEGFIAMVAEQWNSYPALATVGSCCVVGVICERTLYVANLGDSRVVLGTKSHNSGQIAAIQLSTEHNVNIEAERKELWAQHPNDSQIVFLKHGVWRIKGIIAVSRSIGDAYLKHVEFNREPLNNRFISGPLKMPILSAKPTVLSRALDRNDSFLIFASDGLWDHLTNQEAVNIVHNHPRAGSAKRLIQAACREAARKLDMRHSDLQRIARGVRRHFHDDITVAVLFLNHDLIAGGLPQFPSLSITSAFELQ